MANKQISKQEIRLAVALVAVQLERLEDERWCADQLIECVLNLLGVTHQHPQINDIISTLEYTDINVICDAAEKGGHGDE